MERTDVTGSSKQRAVFVAVAAAMLVLWGLSLIPPIENWGNPNEDGFSYVPVFYATIICLPTGLFLFTGAIAGYGRHVERAHALRCLSAPQHCLLS